MQTKLFFCWRSGCSSIYCYFNFSLHPATRQSPDCSLAGFPVHQLGCSHQIKALTKSLLFYLLTKPWESDVGVKTCWIKEAKKQPAALPFWLETQQEKRLSTHLKPETLNLKVPPCSFLCFSLSLFLGPPYSLWLVLVNLSLTPLPDATLILLTQSEFHSAIKYPTTLNPIKLTFRLTMPSTKRESEWLKSKGFELEACTLPV